DRERAEELHVGLLRVDIAETVGHELVADVPLAVDEEAVLPEALLRGARLELGEVDRARGELLEDREQRTGSVLALEADDGRLVVTGGPGNAVPDDDEAGLTRVVLDLDGEGVEAVARQRAPVGDRGEPR